MRAPRPLPDDLGSVPFDRATAADHGVPLSRLRRNDLASPFHGVRTLEPPESLVERCRAYSVRMRAGDVFSHATAAALLGIPLPPALQRRVALDVAAVHPAAAPATRGVIGHRLRNAPDAVQIDGSPVIGPAETWCQPAGLLEVEDLVAAADALLGDGRTPGAAIHEDLAARSRRPADTGRHRSRRRWRWLGSAPDRHRRAGSEWSSSSPDCRTPS